MRVLNPVWKSKPAELMSMASQEQRQWVRPPRMKAKMRDRKLGEPPKEVSERLRGNSLNRHKHCCGEDPRHSHQKPFFPWGWCGGLLEYRPGMRCR